MYDPNKRNLQIIREAMEELGLSDCEEIPNAIRLLKLKSRPTTNAADGVRVCPGCGELKLEETIYCTNCGTDLPRR